MFELDSNEDLTSQEPAPPGVQKCVRIVTYLCAPIGHAATTCISLFYWYDAMMIVFDKVNTGQDTYKVWEPKQSYYSLLMLHRVVLLTGAGFLLVSSVLAMLCLLVAFCKEFVCLLIPYITYHLIFCGLTIGEVAVHVYYTDEGISIAALVRVVLILATSIGIFIVLVYKKVIEMGTEQPVTIVREAERRVTVVPFHEDERKKSDISFIRNPGAIPRAPSIASSHQIDNWVASTATVAKD